MLELHACIVISNCMHACDLTVAYMHMDWRFVRMHVTWQLHACIWIGNLYAYTSLAIAWIAVSCDVLKTPTVSIFVVRLFAALGHKKESITMQLWDGAFEVWRPLILVLLLYTQ